MRHERIPSSSHHDHAGNSSDEMIGDKESNQWAASHRATEMRANHAAQGLVNTNYGEYDPEQNMPVTEQATMLPKFESDAEDVDHLASVSNEHLEDYYQTMREKHNWIGNDLYGHEGNEPYNNNQVLEPNGRKRKAHQMEEGNRLATAHTKSLEADNKRLKTEVTELKRELDKTRADLLTELAELRSKNYFEPAQDADSEIKKEWTCLGFSIRSFVDEHFTKPLSSKEWQAAKNSACYTYLKAACADPESVLQHGLVYQYLVESLIWRFIKEVVFEPGSTFWAGELGEKFDNICHTITG